MEMCVSCWDEETCKAFRAELKRTIQQVERDKKLVKLLENQVKLS